MFCVLKTSRVPGEIPFFSYSLAGVACILEEKPLPLCCSSVWWSLLELVCSGTWCSDEAEIQSCVAGACREVGWWILPGIIKDEIYGFGEFLSLHWICSDLLMDFKINFCMVLLRFSILSRRELLKGEGKRERHVEPFGSSNLSCERCEVCSKKHSLNSAYHMK